jgi:hypothetical protein
MLIFFPLQIFPQTMDNRIFFDGLALMVAPSPKLEIGQSASGAGLGFNLGWNGIFNNDEDRYNWGILTQFAYSHYINADGDFNTFDSYKFGAGVTFGRYVTLSLLPAIVYYDMLDALYCNIDFGVTGNIYIGAFAIRPGVNFSVPISQIYNNSRYEYFYNVDFSLGILYDINRASRQRRQQRQLIVEQRQREEEQRRQRLIQIHEQEQQRLIQIQEENIDFENALKHNSLQASSEYLDKYRRDKVSLPHYNEISALYQTQQEKHEKARMELVFNPNSLDRKSYRQTTAQEFSYNMTAGNLRSGNKVVFIAYFSSRPNSNNYSFRDVSYRLNLLASSNFAKDLPRNYFSDEMLFTRDVKPVRVYVTVTRIESYGECKIDIMEWGVGLE